MSHLPVIAAAADAGNQAYGVLAGAQAGIAPGPLVQILRFCWRRNCQVHAALWLAKVR